MRQPERLATETSSKAYDLRTDVWAYGLSLLELMMLAYPYGEGKAMFPALKEIVQRLMRPVRFMLC